MTLLTTRFGETLLAGTDEVEEIKRMARSGPDGRLCAIAMLSKLRYASLRLSTQVKSENWRNGLRAFAGLYEDALREIGHRPPGANSAKENGPASGKALDA